MNNIHWLILGMVISSILNRITGQIPSHDIVYPIAIFLILSLSIVLEKWTESQSNSKKEELQNRTKKKFVN